MTETTTETPQPAPALFAIVELFGHAKIAGAVSEQTFGGGKLVRVDVPEIVVDEDEWDDEAHKYIKRRRLIQAHTRSFGAGAIYAISWCDEETARLAAALIKHEPLRPYSARRAVEAIASPRAHLDFDDGSDD